MTFQLHTALSRLRLQNHVALPTVFLTCVTSIYSTSGFLISVFVFFVSVICATGIEGFVFRDLFSIFSLQDVDVIQYSGFKDPDVFIFCKLYEGM